MDASLLALKEWNTFLDLISYFVVILFLSGPVLSYYGGCCDQHILQYPFYLEWETSQKNILNKIGSETEPCGFS